MKTNKLINCPQCGGFGFASTPVSTDYEITVCRAKTCELCRGAGVIEVPMTNADRIRSMSDEELVVFLDGFSGRCLDCAEDAKNKNCPIYKEGHYCRPKDIMEWLQQPAKEDDHDERKENENVRR